MTNRLEQSPFEHKFKLGPDEAEPGTTEEELFRETTQTLEREAPLVAQELEEMSAEQKSALDQTLNSEGLSWVAFKGVNAENQTRAADFLKEWIDETDPIKKKEATKKLINNIEN